MVALRFDVMPDVDCSLKCWTVKLVSSHFNYHLCSYGKDKLAIRQAPVDNVVPWLTEVAPVHLEVGVGDIQVVNIRFGRLRSEEE